MSKIVNVMCSKVLGGVEQEFLDYTKAFILTGNEVLSVTDCKAKINCMLLENKKHKNINVNFGVNGLLAFYRIYKECKKFNADVIITHSKKTIFILKIIANLLKIKLVAVAHNDKFKHIYRADAIFSITQYQKDIFVKKGYPEDRIYVIPNMIECIPEYKEKNVSEEIVFGSMGRFDPIKGFDTFLRALKELKDKGYKFKAKLGGGSTDENEEYRLRQLVEKCNLTENVEFLGWVSNKKEFYNNIDVFVLPSYYESFGIVLLEAMSYSLPIISSTTEGPKEIFANDNNASLMFNNNDFCDLAKQMIYVIENKDKLKILAQNGYNLCKDNYLINVVARNLDQAINSIIKKIDLVYLWCDSSDKEWNKKRLYYLKKNKQGR